MRRSTSKGATALPVVVLACLAGGGAVLGQPPMPLGGEFLVNAYTSNDQSTPAIASDAAGNFVVVWRSNLQDGCVVHVTRGRFACVIGDEVTVGHRAVVHGCRVGDGALIGIGARRYGAHPVQSRFGTHRAPFLVA